MKTGEFYFSFVFFKMCKIGWIFFCLWVFESWSKKKKEKQYFKESICQRETRK